MPFVAQNILLFFGRIVYISKRAIDAFQADFLQKCPATKPKLNYPFLQLRTDTINLVEYDFVSSSLSGVQPGEIFRYKIYSYSM